MYEWAWNVFDIEGIAQMINIAIVEDEAMYAKQLQEFLLQYQKENGEVFNITVYSDGDQIVHKYKSQFDIILMDVEMKFMDGMSAAEEIRKADTEVMPLTFNIINISNINPNSAALDVHRDDFLLTFLHSADRTV